jgi:hypothetical protein
MRGFQSDEVFDAFWFEPARPIGKAIGAMKYFVGEELLVIVSEMHLAIYSSLQTKLDQMEKCV